jgi:hypothetical protein
VFLAAILLLHPAWKPFLSGSDSTAYLATGVSLARHGTLSREDEIAPTVAPLAKWGLFDSMSQTVGHSGPPYRRMPGAMLLESLDATKAWPAFFPVPAVWAAIGAAAAGPTAAPIYTTLFASLSLWAFFLLARSWLSAGWAAVATVLLGSSAAFLTAAKMPLSEPIACFFALGALALHTESRRWAGGAGTGDDAHPRSSIDGTAADAVLTGVALGAALFTRVEFAIYIAMALALLPWGQRAGAGHPRFPIPPLALACLAIFAGLTALQFALVPGSYVDPLLDHAVNTYLSLLYRFGQSPGTVTAAFVLGALIAATAAWRLGAQRSLRLAVVVGILAGHAAGSNYLGVRTPMWLSFSIGIGGLVLAALGMVAAWRQRHRLPGAPFVLALGLAAASILFYNPHVYPSLPWGARRFVPLLLPLLVLLAVHACARFGARSRLVAFAATAVLAWGVVDGSRPMWGRELYAGSWEALSRFERVLPRDGLILYDRDISSLMLGPSMWLVHDRNGVAVWPLTTKDGRQQVAYFRQRDKGAGDIHFVTRGIGSPVKIPFVSMTLVERVNVSLPMMEGTYDTKPSRIVRYLLPIAIYRVERSPDRRGACVF